MAAEYQLRIVDTAGATQAVITDYLQLAYTRVVNEPGLLSFELADNHPALAYIVHNNQVEVYRRNVDIGLAWTLDFVGIIRSLRWATDELTTLSVEAPGALHILSWRTIAYKAGTLNRSRFVTRKTESVMKDIVRYNCTSSGTTTDGRLRAATSSGKVSGLYTITIQADAAAGNDESIGCAYQGVLETLQALAQIGGGDFDLVKTSGVTFDFRFYAGQRGTDRRTSLFFALERGNMSAPSFVDNRIDERTSAIVGGEGEEAMRNTIVVTGDKYLVGSRDFEMFVDSTQSKTTSALTTAGQVALYEARKPEAFSFTALQAPNAYYGVHYDLGDLVTATYRGVSYWQKVQAVAVSFTNDTGEQIAVTMELYV